ncbi:MAG: hypothetical protein IJB47_01965 [Oscillospiraceae bacterium]|nr:hypothetical protein [Oscillospiraceae bacterium]
MGGSILIFLAVLIVGSLKDITITDGVLAKDGKETEVTITITRTNFGKLFNWISKPVLIKVGDETYEYEITGKRLGIYNLGSKIYTFEDIRHFSIGRYDNTVGSVMGTLYFSNNMKNIAIITNYESIYSDSADEAFLKSMFPEN